MDSSRDRGWRRGSHCAFRRGVRHVASAGSTRATNQQEPRRLAIDVPGRLDDLIFQPISRTAPAPQ